MDKFRFWKRRPPEPASIAEPVIRKFNVQPRTDVGAQGLPTDPDAAARVVAMRKRREQLVNELASAQAAHEPDNRWQAEIRLIGQAIIEITGDLEDLGSQPGAPGVALPSTPIIDVAVELEPVVRVSFRIGDESFAYAEDIDWAERGTQLARSDLVIESGDVAALIPADFDDDSHTALQPHLEQSLFVFASDMRDRVLAADALPDAALSDLAVPDSGHGGWLDWAGHSPIAQSIAVERARLVTERTRLDAERTALLAEEARIAEEMPFLTRRLAELDKEIAALISGSGAG